MPPATAMSPAKVGSPSSASPAPKMAGSCAAVRASIDYSRFDSIGDDDDDVRAGNSHRAPPAPPGKSGADAGTAKISTAAAASLQRSKAAAAASLDYSRFENISEEDATLQPTEVDALWQRHRKLRLMRGEEPLDFAEWRKRRAQAAAAGRADPDLPGRGLWCRTNMEEDFDREARRVDSPPDDELPALPAPELLSHLRGAPHAKSVDATAWARKELHGELVKACATDRGIPAEGPGAVLAKDFRTDAIVYQVQVGEGNAALVAEGEHYLCGYRFKVDVSYSVNIAERPLPGQEEGAQSRFMGDIAIPELVSGGAPGSVVKGMRTSLRDPKPSKQQLILLRPVLLRLELSLAYFVRRFERSFLMHPVEAASWGASKSSDC